ncbi:hypothetical protein AVEN_52679-1 [Araneus ventricosus]|uniref:RNase H type-1 domain-containing protein n=1 Tax=Araneus ventricosus TaxID=182803 RepID=A0A4Y2TK27_ARAVE|nr:hypothetical protein AVEN_52679-1 [Araneus ventricosus]
MTLHKDLDLPSKDFNPPWLLISIPWQMDLDLNRRVLKIFTDGSKLNERVGCGIVCFDEMNQEIWSLSHRLSDNSSVFIAEAFAILFAVKRVYQLAQEILILSDSRSVLMALESVGEQTSLIEVIKSILKDHRNIKLGSVKAHIGISGNEKADLLAKEATRKEQIDTHIKYSKTWLKNCFNTYIIRNWQSRWENSKNARYTFGLFTEASFNRCFGDFLNPNGTRCFSYSSKVTALEIERILMSSSMDKAPGPDGLTLGIIKELYFSNKDPFIDIMNVSLRNGNFPTSWKEEKVILIPKEGKDLQRVTSYRPICLLSTWGKILDKIITQRLQRI